MRELQKSELQARRRAAVVVVAMSLVALAVACQSRTRSVPAPAPVRSVYCWSVFRSHQPVDTVASYMVRAAAAAGFRQPRVERIADTARVTAGPQLLDGGPPNTAFVADVVAYPLDDRIRVRFEAGWIVPSGGWKTPSDSLSA